MEAKKIRGLSGDLGREGDIPVMPHQHWTQAWDSRTEIPSESHLRRLEGVNKQPRTEEP